MSWKFNQYSEIVSENLTIKDQLKILKDVETNVAKMDKYVEFCVVKYQTFVFNLEQFMQDIMLAQTQFI